MRNIAPRRQEVYFGDFKKFEKLDFADDIGFLTHRFRDMGGKLQDLSKVGKKNLKTNA